MHDLVIIGAGPAGLSAAINAASEGLSVLVLDNGNTLGGQAKESHGIENYPGFPEGITGDDLMRKLVVQAGKFETKFICPVSVAAINLNRDGSLIVLTDDYHEYPAKSVLVTTGLQYRRLHAEGISDLLGRGVSYGMPVGAIPRSKTCTVTIVGGANSAGQAVLKLAPNPLMKIKMVIRKTLETQMSQYAVERIRKLRNVEVIENAEVIDVYQQKQWLGSMRLKLGSGIETIHSTNFMFIFIGAIPKTIWMKGYIALDKDNYILTGDRKNEDAGTALPFETSMRGVFAAGDVRSSSIKRIAASSGEGSSVIPYIHKFLAA